MGYISIFLKLVLFFVSNLGIWEFFRRKSKMDIFYLPAFTVSLQISILFLAGILNCLKITAIVIFVVGFCLAVYYLFKDFKAIIDVYLNIGYIFFVFLFILILIGCKGHVLSHFDNFTHWALVVKTMLLADRYPTFRDTLISFQSYPLGCATFIYYFVKIVGKSESLQMCAQSYMMLSCILPVFKYVKKNKLACFVYTLLFANYLLCYNVPIVELFVDTVLPLHGMAMLLFIYSECFDFDLTKKEKVSILYAIPFLIVSVQIKNSGIFFVIVSCILIAGAFKYDRSEIKQKLVTMLVPFFSLYLWQAHCNYVFSSALYTKHAMTIENYKNSFLLKSAQEFKRIIGNFLKLSFSFQTAKEFYFIILFFIILGILLPMFSDEIKKKYKKIILSSIFLYITYMIGMMFMYFFSMGGDEAANLAGYDRYRKTIFVCVLYLILVFSLEMISEIKNNWKKWVCLIICFGMLIFNWGKFRSYETILTIPKDVPETRHWIEQEISRYNIPLESSYMILCPSSVDGNYATVICQYFLYSSEVSVQTISEKIQLDVAKEYEYIFVMDEENNIIQQWVKENYPNQIGNKVIVTSEAKK